MVNVALVFLALFAVIVFERSFAMGVALAGLIWVAWKLNSRLAEVSQKLKRVEDELEAGMSERALQHMLQADSQQTDKSEADTNEQPEQSITETSRTIGIIRLIGKAILLQHPLLQSQKTYKKNCRNPTLRKNLML